MAKRRVLSLRWDLNWRLEEGHGLERDVVDSYPHEYTKKEAIRDARSSCRIIHAEGDLVQLRVFNLNGRISFEATYGKDPRRTAG